MRDLRNDFETAGYSQEELYFNHLNRERLEQLRAADARPDSRPDRSAPPREPHAGQAPPGGSPQAPPSGAKAIPLRPASPRHADSASPKQRQTAA